MLEQDSWEDIKATTCPSSPTCSDCLSKNLCDTYLRAYKERMQDSGIAGIQDEECPEEDKPKW